MPTIGLQSLAYLGANLELARNPVLITSTVVSPNQPPPPNGGGLPIEGATRALVKLSVREHPFRRTCYYRIIDFDATATYTVVINGTSVVYDASVENPTDTADLVAGIAAAINANGTLNTDFVAAATVYQGTTPDAVVIYRLDGLDYSFDGSRSGVIANIAMEADARSARFALFGLPSVVCASPPVLGGFTLPVPYRNLFVGWTALSDPLGVNPDGIADYVVGHAGLMIPAFPVAGLSAIFNYLTSVTGVPGDGIDVQPRAFACVYPCEQETT